MSILRDGYTFGLSGLWLRRPLVLAAVCLGVGDVIGLCGGLPVELYMTGAAVILLYLIVSALLGKRRAGALMALILSLGGWLGSARAFIPAVPPEGQYAITCRVTDIVKREDDRVVLHADNVVLNDKQYPGGARLYLYDYYGVVLPDGLEIGARIRLIGKVWLPDGVRNPLGFDFKAYLARRGVYFGVNAQLRGIQIEPTGALAVKRVMYDVREGVKSRLTLLFGDETGSLMQGILLGAKDEMQDELLLSFRESGLSHLLAVSGLHISFMAMLLERLLRRRLWPKQRLYIIIAMLAAYCALTGFTPSVVRASVMGVVLILDRCVGRRYDGPSALMCAFAVIIAFNPGAIVEAGFALSFAAVLSLQLLSPVIRGMLPKPELSDRLRQNARHAAKHKRARLFIARLPSKALDMLAASASITLGMVPFMSLFFYGFSLVALIGNFIAIPLAMLLLPLGWLALLLSAIWLPMGGVAANVAGVFARMLIDWTRWLAAIPWNTLRMPMVSPLWLIPWLLLMVWCSRFRPLKPKLRKYGLLALVFMAWLMTAITNITPPGLTAIMLDVGQADSFVFSMGQRAVIVDVGKASSATAQYLLSHGLTVDALFISHLHADHAGALSEVVRSLDVSEIYLPPHATDYADESVLTELDALVSSGLRLTTVSAGDGFDFLDGVHVKILHPDESDTFADGNDVSTVMSVEYAGRSFLMTGDITSDAGFEFAGECDVLKVAHHGSASSNDAAMLSAVNPVLSLISVGAGNGYGHPAEAALERLENSGTIVMRTDECGAITVYVAPDGEATVSRFLPPAP